MLATPEPAQLENVLTAVPSVADDDAVASVAVQVQARTIAMRWRKSTSCCCCNMALLIEQLASMAAIGRFNIKLDGCQTPPQTNSSGRWSLLNENEMRILRAPLPSLPELLAVESAALQEYFEDGLRR